MLKKLNTILFTAIIAITFGACALQKSTANDIEVEEETQEENSKGEDNQNEDLNSEVEQQKEQRLSDYSNVYPLLDYDEYISENEMLWFVADTEGMLLQADLSGKIYNSYITEDASNAEAALTENRILFYSNDEYYIYDFEIGRDVTDEYTGGDKEICYANRECIFCVQEEETYNSLNIYMYILDNEGNELLSFSSAEMSEKYNVEWERNWEYGACGSGIYYIQTDSIGYNCCFIDLKREKVYMSSNLPSSNSGGIYSDGEYILDCQPNHGQVVINCESEVVSELPNKGTVSGLSEGKVYWEDRYGVQGYLNVDGSTAIEFNYENTSITDATQFENGYAMLEFNKKFTTIIDTEGNFLFEPVEGTIYRLLDINGSNAYVIYKDMAYYLLDETGEKCEKISDSDSSLYPMIRDEGGELLVFKNGAFSAIPIG